MLIAAVSDIHYPKFFNIFSKSLENVRKADIFILAGDIANKGNVVGYQKVVNMIRKKFGDIEIFACFGNEEYDEKHEELKKIPGVEFFEEKVKIVKDKFGKTFAFLGTRGVLDKPTTWQLRNIPNIKEVYAKRMERIKALLKESKNRADFVIFFSHYAPSYLTLEGERKEVYPNLASKNMEKILLEFPPDIVIHGHAHHGKSFSFLKGIPIYNVALPLNKRITLIDSSTIGGLKRFW